VDLETEVTVWSWSLLQKRRLCSADTECELAIDSDSEGCKASRAT